MLGHTTSPSTLHRIGLATLVLAQLVWLAIDRTAVRAAPPAHAALGLLYRISITCMLLAVSCRRRGSDVGRQCA